MKQQLHSLMELKQLQPCIGVWCMMCGRAGSVTWLCGVVWCADKDCAIKNDAGA